MSTYEGTNEIVVLCPTRENAAGTLGMVESFYDTIHRIGTEVIIVIDEDEPQADEYLAIPEKVYFRQVGFGVQRPDPPRIMVVEGGSLTKATNEAVERIWEADCIIGHVGDDHRFRTPGWDNRIRDAILEGAAVAYAYDGFASAWASQWFTPAIIPRTLGWLAVPGSKHLTIDDVFMDIGAGLDRLTFLKDVFIEHLHPAGGKVPWRDIVKSHYLKPIRAQEEANMEHYRNTEFANDINKLQAVLHLPVEPVLDTAPGLKYRQVVRGLPFQPDNEPTMGELEEFTGLMLTPNSAAWVKARRQWHQRRRAAGA